MNKLCAVVFLLALSALNVQSSDQKFRPATYMYAAHPNDLRKVIKIECKTGIQEIISVPSGQTRDEKIEELQMLEVMAWRRFQAQRNK